MRATLATLTVRTLPFLAVLSSVASATASPPRVRRAEVTFTIDLRAAPDAQDVRLWLPRPVSDENQVVQDVRVEGNFARHAATTEPEHGSPILYAEWRGPMPSRTLTYVFRVARREAARRDLTPADGDPPPDQVARYLRPTRLGPIDGEVRATAERITQGQTTTLGKARAIYDWIVDTMHRDPKVVGCGPGDVEKLLVGLGGKCGDLHSVYVALARSVGVPAREVFGIRLPAGAAGDMTKAQHCWVEFFLQGRGWVPADPSDVRKIMLERKLELGQEREHREYYFGGVDQNRIAYWNGRDLRLDPPQRGEPLNYLMYPYAEADGRALGDLYGFELGYQIAWRDLGEAEMAPAAPAVVAPPAPPPAAAPTPAPSGDGVSFYGTVRLDAIYSDSRLNHPQFPMWVESEAPGAGDDDHLDVHPRLTRLGVRARGARLARVPGAAIEGNVEVDFQNRAVDEARGGSESRQLLRLRHAYFKLARGPFSVLGGQTWDLISPLWPAVNADSMMWNSGNLGDRRPQLRLSYEPTIAGDARLQVQVAAARTGAVDLKDLDANGVRDGDDSGLPMVQARVGLAALPGRLDVGVWAHRGWERTGRVPAQPGTDPPAPVLSGRRSFSTYGVGGDLKLAWGPLTLTGEVFRGANLSDLRGGIGQGVGKVSGEEIETQGGWGQLRVAALPWLSLAAGAGLDDVDGGELIAGDRTRNLAAFGNVEADLGGGFLLALDYISWRTTFVERPRGDANRFDLSASYKF